MRLSVVLVLLAALLPAQGRADEAPIPAVLRERAAQWGKVRSEVIGTCGTCAGRGWVIAETVVNRRIVQKQVKCDACGGTRMRVSAYAVKRVMWDLVSPARRTDRSLPDLDALRESVQKAPANFWTRPLTVDAIRLVDEGHAVVTYGGPKDPMEVRWAFLDGDQPGTKSWYVYTQEVDGPWPSEAGKPPAEAQSEPDRPLPREDLERLANIMRLDGLHHTPTRSTYDGDTLVVFLRWPEAKSEAELRTTVDAEVYLTTRAAFQVEQKVARVKLAYETTWRDKFGAKIVLPWITRMISRGDFSQIVPGRLSREELTALWDERGNQPKGYILWIGKD